MRGKEKVHGTLRDWRDSLERVVQRLAELDRNVYGKEAEDRTGRGDGICVVVASLG